MFELKPASSGHSTARICRPSRWGQRHRCCYSWRYSALRYSVPTTVRPWMAVMSRCSASMSKNCRPIWALNRERGISRRIPCSKRDLHQNRTILHEPIHSKNWSGYQTLRGSNTVLDSILHQPGAGAHTACRVSGACRPGSLPWSIPEEASRPGLARALPSRLWLLI